MKVVLFMVESANGIIARETGEEDFLSDVGWYDFKKLSEQSGCFIIGRRTYDTCEKYYTKYGLNDVKSRKIVVSKGWKKAPKGFDVARSPVYALKKAAALGLKGVVLCGGSKTNGAFLKSGLVDEIILNVEPVVLGKGIKVFSDEDFEHKLKLVSVRKRQKGIIQLHYKVLKKS